MHRDRSPEKEFDDHADRINAAWVGIQGPLIAFFSRRLKSQDDVRDAAQDIYLRLLDCADPANIRDLHSYALNLAKNIVKDRQRDRTASARLARSFFDEQPSRQTLKERGPTELVCAAQEDLEAIMLAFDELPAKTKLIFAADLQGEPVSSVAARLGVQPCTVHREVGRARERLQRALNRPRRA